MFINKAKPVQYMVQTLALLAGFGFLATACQPRKGNDDILLSALIVLYASNPCNFQSAPQLSAVRPSVANVWPTVQGRVLQANGDPAIAALVIVQDSDTDGASDGPGKRFVSTFTGLNGDGSFYMAGLPNITDQYRISVEPIDSTYDGRIDTHIDCFQNPSSFSPGYYTGPSSTINSNTGSAQTFQLNQDASQIYDAGDIILR
ncbi:MAG: carboxypeptidase-like regulatory domain-containing protein [Leptospiraceae bacterium]